MNTLFFVLLFWSGFMLLMTLFKPQLILSSFKTNPPSQAQVFGNLSALAVVFLIGFILTMDDSKKVVSETEFQQIFDKSDDKKQESKIISAAHAEEGGAITVPEQEKKFLNIMGKYAVMYNNADNELKKSKIWKERDRKLSNLLGESDSIENWIGKVESMGTTGEGKAYITIKINNHLSFMTSNNAISDVLSETLISQDSPLYDKISELKEGDVVQFSASFTTLPGQMQWQTTNFTEDGKINSPDFVVRFSSIQLAKSNN